MDARPIVRICLGLAAGALVAGCEATTVTEDLDPLPIEYTTEEVEVATDFDEPLCDGDLRWLDEHTRRLEALLGVEGEKLRTIYAYDEEDIVIVDGDQFTIQVPGCPMNILGCYHRDEQVGIGVPQSLAHELVHLVGRDLGPSFERFWYEGLAEALSEHPVNFIPSDLVEESTSDDVLYLIPGHFIRWLIEREGIQPVLRAFRGESFEASFGIGLAEMEQIYDAEATEVMPSPFACEDEPLLPSSGGSFELVEEFDCNSENTTRIRHLTSFDHVATIRIFSVEEDERFVVEANGVDHVRIGGCTTEPGDVVEFVGDVESDAYLLASFNPARTTEVTPGEEVFLPAGTYRLVLLVEDLGVPQPFEFSLTPVE